MKGAKKDGKKYIRKKKHEMTAPFTKNKHF